MMELVLNLLVPVTFVLFLVLERVFPARPLPKVRFWLLKGIVFFVGVGLLNGIVPAVLASLLGSHAPVHLAVIGTVPSAILAFLVSDMVSYAVHRTMHNVPFVWRWTHQMHHSAERLDMAGAAYFHPLDVTVQIVAATVPTILLGLSPQGAALAGYIGFLFGVFQHLNVKTPQWLGYVIQRPEAHSVHHARGVHAYNYGNFPLWDIVLGTFRNPAGFVEEAGFWDGASAKMGSMLLGRDVAAPPR
jgi:sterol desaturase/sphingolipid hydroxylase (fatty acid hydroxylase superfamily)